MNPQPLCVVLCVGSLMTAPLAQAGSPGRETVHTIAFRPGHTHARVQGFLRGPQDGALFAFRARAGQHLQVKVVRGGPLVIGVTSPSGRESGDKGVTLDLTASETGLYKIRVGENQMAEGGPDSFVLDVLRH